jgi:AmmeMemoRadiSam system protein B/AmmeMemoRadiSam system protein A
MADVHASPYAGSWYPGRAAPLAELLDDLLERSRRRTGAVLLRRPLGFVVPHAGLVYSGAVAAAAYRHLEDRQPERVVLVGFSHRAEPDGIAIPDLERIATPLGEAALDRAAMERLARSPLFRLVSESSVCDHSVEIQLPFVQKLAPGTPVLPLYVGRLDAAGRGEAARLLAGLVRPGSVFFVSSDFTHYGRGFGYQPFPADEEVADRLRDLDSSVIEAAATLDDERFLERLAASGATVCGSAPIALWLRTLACLEGDEVFQVELDYQTSGDLTGDFEQSVSYAALGYFPARSYELDREDQELLLESAAGTLRRLLETGERRSVPPRAMRPGLSRRAGVFVSLHRGAELRGCVGHRLPGCTVAEAVPELTLAAALDDPRFRPLEGAAPEMEIEISVLSPMKRVRDSSGFHIGAHGAFLECHGRQALLLPQVAAGRDWTATQFLGALARKAGLSPVAWASPDARLSVFRAQVFGRPLASDEAFRRRAAGLT